MGHKYQDPRRPRGNRVGTNFQLHSLPGYRIRYQDPTDRFIEDRTPIQCVLCGFVPRVTKSGLFNGTCKSQKACEKRQRDNLLDD